MASTLALDAYNPGLGYFKNPRSFSIDPVYNVVKKKYVAHDGDDWGTRGQTGVAIFAAASGVVVLAGEVRGYGNLLVIEHAREDGTKFRTLYGHMAHQSSLNVGGIVLAGQTIGEAGDTGGSEGIHLHFEVIVDLRNTLPQGGTGRVDPASFTQWGGLPHMIGTDRAGNTLIAQTYTDNGSITESVRTYTQAGAFVASNVVMTVPIYSAPGVLAGFTRSILEVGPNSVLTVFTLNFDSQIVQVHSSSTNPAIATITTRGGVTIETTSAGVFARMAGVDGDIPVAADGSFVVPAGDHSVTIRFNPDPLIGGVVIVGGTTYNFQPTESLRIVSGKLSAMNSAYGWATSTEVLLDPITGGGFQFDYEQGANGARLLTHHRLIPNGSGGLGVELFNRFEEETDTQGGIDRNVSMFQGGREILLAYHANLVDLRDEDGDGYWDDASFALQSLSIGGQSTFDSSLVRSVMTDTFGGPANAWWATDPNGQAGYSALQQIIAAADPTNPTGLRPLATLPNGQPWWMGVLSPYAGLSVADQAKWKDAADALSELQGLIGLGQTRNPLYVAGFIANLANRNPGTYVEWIDLASGALNAATGLHSFIGALERGDGLRALASGGQLASQALGLYTSHLTQVYEALLAERLGQIGAEALGGEVASALSVQALDSAISETAASLAAASQALNTLTEALPYLNVILKIKDDPAGAIINLIAIAAECPVIGWVYAVYKLIEFALTDIEIGARAQFIPAPGDANAVATQITWVGATGGQQQAQAQMNGLLELINQIKATFPDSGVVAERLPKLEFKGMEDGGGWITLSFTDGTTGAATLRSYSLNGDWIGEGGSISVGEAAGVGGPVGTIAGDAEYFKNMYEQFQEAMLASRAIVPAWQAATIAAQRARGDTQAGLTPEQRAVLAGQLYTQAQADAASANFKPVALDLDGGGIVIAERAAGQGVLFDINDDGFAQQTDWLGPREVFLVIDRDGSGSIDSAADMFTESRVNNTARGLNVLRELDANGDGLINATDPAFAQLRLWRDLTHDGTAQAAELDTLAELGITGINITTGQATRVVNGVTQAVPLSQVSLAHAQSGVLSQVVDNSVWMLDQASGMGEIYAGAVASLAGQLGHSHASADGKLIANDDATTTLEDVPLRINIRQLLDNDQHLAATATTTWQISAVGNAMHGSVSLGADGVIAFTPAAQFAGQASFEYTVVDNAGRSTTGIAQIGVEALNDAPTISNGPLLRQAEIVDVSYSGGDEFTLPMATLPAGSLGAVAATQGITVMPGATRNAGEIVGLKEGQIYIGVSNAGATIWRPLMIATHGGRLTAGDVEDGGNVTVAIGTQARYGEVVLHADMTWTYESTSRSADSAVITVTDGDGAVTELMLTIAARPVYEVRDLTESLSALLLVDGYDFGARVAHDPDDALTSGKAMADLYKLTAGAANYAISADLANQGSQAVDAAVSSEIAAATGGEEAAVAQQSNDAQVRANAEELRLAIESVVRRARDASERFSAFFDPVVLDLNGNGVELIGYRDSKAFFDFDGNGTRERTGWVSGSDGLLAFDMDSNGRIDRREEIRFKDWLPGATTDLQGLAYFDSNHDGKLSSADAQWGKFGVWQDKNENGSFEPGEFTSLASRGIAEISLTSDQIRRDINGNTVFGLGQYKLVDGTAVTLADARFRVSEETYAPASAANDLTAVAAGSVLSSGTGSDTLRGSVAADLLYGGADGDRLLGGAGNDLIYGDAGNDSIQAGDGDDRVVAGPGNDVIDAEAGDDIVFGGPGADKMTGGDGNDHLYGDEGNDLLFGGAGNDLLIGGTGNDTLAGQEGDDELYGGDGADQMAGGLGNDSYWVGNLGDVAEEAIGQGQDTVHAYIDYVLGQNIEDLELHGLDELSGTGNALSNRLTGNASGNELLGMAGNDVLDGGAGNDVLEGGAGNDTLIGGAGNDAYRWGRGQGNDTIQEAQSAGDTAIDTVLVSGTTSSDLDLRRAGADLILHINSTGEELRVIGGADKTSTATWVERIVFSSGLEWKVIDRINQEAELFADKGIAIEPRVNTLWTQIAELRPRDPLAIDLDGDGIETAGAATNPILFDHDADGVRTGTGWLRPDDGWLVMDRNANGSIDSGRELFGVDTQITVTEVPAGGGTSVTYQRNAYTGFEALRSLDINGDHVFNAADPAFGLVRIWRDLNQDGISQSGELSTLASNAITGIQLVETPTTINLGNGNSVTGTAVVLRSSGGNTQIDSVGLTAGNLNLGENPFYRQFTDTIAHTAAVNALPEVQGSGWLRDLHDAMSLGNAAATTLRNSVSAFAVAGTRDAQRSLLDGVIRAWADSTGEVDTRSLRAVVSNTVNQTATTKTVHYESADPSFYLAMPTGKIDAVAIGFASANYMKWITEAGGNSVRVMNTAGESIWAHAAVLEIVNGVRYFDVTATEALGAAPATTGTGLVTRWTVSINDLQANQIELAYATLRESVWQSLVLQTRLKPYLDAILATEGVGGLKFNGTMLLAMLETKRGLDPVAAVADLVDLMRIAPNTLAAAGINAAATLVAWVAANPPALATLTALGVITDRAIPGGASDDILVAGLSGGNRTGGAGADTLAGSTAIDQLSGGDGNDLLFGGAGDDNLGGDAGDDTLEGGVGNDWTMGGVGNDLFRFSRGDGQDVLYEAVDISPTRLNTLQFGVGISPADIGFKRLWAYGYDNLELSIAGTSDKVMIRGFYEGADPFGPLNPIQRVQFADGTSWDVSAMLNAIFAGTSAGDNTAGTVGHDTIHGVGGADTLMGMSGDDLLLGEAGDDVLDGGAGDDTLEGGPGVDVLTGGPGNDVYLFGRGDGQDTIQGADDFTPTRLNTLLFKPGVLPTDLTIRRIFENGHQTLEVAILGTADKIGVRYFMYGDDPAAAHNPVQQFRFADGTTWDIASIVAKALAGTSGPDSITGTLNDDTLDGLAGADSLLGANGNDLLRGGPDNDTLRGDAGDDTLDGGPGNDELTGGTGNDVIGFGRGDGADTLHGTDDNSASRFNTIEFKAGVLPTEVALKRVIDGGYQSLELSIAGTQDKITVRYFLYADDPSLWFNPLQQVRFADGTTWDFATILARLFAGTAGDDSITGTLNGDVIYGQAGADSLLGAAGNDTLEGGPGNDELTGGVGDDVIVFGRGDGQDVIWGTDDATATRVNTLLLKAGVLPADLVLKRVVDLGYPSLEVGIAGTTDNVTVRYFFYGDDQFNGFNPLQQIKFADGTTWNMAAIMAKYLGGTAGADSIAGTVYADLISGQAGDDTLMGGAGNDTLDGGAGNDQLQGEFGNNTYLFGKGDGQDTINNGYDYSVGRVNTLLFKAGVLPSEVVSRRVYDSGYESLELSILGTTDKITVRMFFTSNDPYGVYNTIQQVKFSNGSVWTIANILSEVFKGTAGVDTIAGTIAADTINGQAGADALYGRDGDDSLIGGADNDQLFGEAGNDTLDGGAGNDTLFGAQGNNTYLFGKGDGQDTISALYDASLGRIGTIQFKSGVLPTEVVAKRGAGASANNLELSIVGTTDTLTVVEYFYSDDPYHGFNPVQQLKFSNGTVWTIANVIAEAFKGSAAADTYTGTISADTLNGLAGADIIYGRDGNDLLNGGPDNDLLFGEAGNDTLDGGTGNDRLNDQSGNNVYVFTKGDGQDSIDATNETSPRKLNTVLFKAGTLPSEVSVQRATDGGNESLVLSTVGTTDTITVKGFFLGVGPTNVNNPVQAVRFADGTTWDMTTILGMLATNAINGTIAADSLIGTAAGDKITGLDANDTLNAAAGDDWLDGGLGNDSMIGGAGNDTYVVDAIGDVITEQLNEGVDTVRSPITWTLGANLDNLVLTGTAAINGTGNVLDNRLFGNPANNLLDGGLGADVMAGGAGNDSYVADSISDVIVEQLNEGTDTVSTPLAWVLGANLENLTLTGTATVNATGNELNNTLIGNSANNLLTGGAGNDALTGGTGADTMVGGLGNDSYTVDSLLDVVVELPNEGTDLLGTPFTTTLPADIENLTLLGAAAVNGTGNGGNNLLTGNSAANVLVGGIGNDTLNGAAGNDTLNGGVGDDSYFVDSVGDVVNEAAAEGIDLVTSSITWALGLNIENLTLSGTAIINGTGNATDNTLTGNAAANVLTGLAGDDVLNGAAGADTMIGGLGNDSYTVDNAGDIITEALNEGSDIVNAGITWVLGANLENLLLTGAVAINGTGNELNNTLTGNTAANLLTGGAGNDVLNGGTGADTLVGGLGDDSYFIDNAADVVTENAGEGIDGVSSSVAWTLSANVENLTLTGTTAINGTGNASPNTITGNSAANRLEGGLGADTLAGGAGADTYVFAVGYGIDTIQENDSTASIKDIVQFTGATPITQALVQFKRVADNLEVWVNGTTDKVVVSGWYLATARQVEEFRFTDGTVLTGVQVQALATVASSLSIEPQTIALLEGDAGLIGVPGGTWGPDPWG